MGGLIVIQDSNNHEVSFTPKDGATGARTVTIPDSVPDLDTANTFGGNIEAPSMTIAGKTIVESGSNANGTYIKYADGTLIQYSLSGGSSDIAGITVTFPTTFIDTAYRIIANSADSSSTSILFPKINSKTTSNFNLRSYLRVDGSSTYTTSVYSIDWVAIGRWY